MSNPLKIDQSESATAQPLIPRYVIIRRFSGYDFAPESQEPHFALTAANDPDTAEIPPHYAAVAKLPTVAAVFIGVIGSAAVVAGIAVQAAALIH